MSKKTEMAIGSQRTEPVRHSDLDIYNGCVDLIGDIVESFQDWYISIHGADALEGLLESEQEFGFYLFPSQLVGQLFLKHTDESSMEGCWRKLGELGIDNECLAFGFKEEQQ